VIVIRLTGRNLALIAAAAATLWLLSKVWGVVLLAASALLIAGALMPYVDWLWRRTHRRALSVVIVLGALLLTLSIALAVVIPQLIAQGRSLWEEWPEQQARAARFADEHHWDGLRDRIQEFDAAALVAPRLMDTSRVVFNVLFTAATVFFLSAYFLLDARRLKRFLYFCTPRPWHPHIRDLLPALQRVVGGYIRGQVITSAAIAVFTFLLLTILQVPNPIALAAIAAIADVIPFIGVYVMLTPMVLTALSVSVTTAIVVAGATIAYQQFEDRVLVPRVYGQTLRLPTVAVVLSVLAGGELLGPAGALLALPLAATIRVVVEYFAGVRKATSATRAGEIAPAGEVFAPDSGVRRAAAHADRPAARVPRDRQPEHRRGRRTEMAPGTGVRAAGRRPPPRGRRTSRAR
jgi:predicted PurR-regulated permease PerM